MDWNRDSKEIIINGRPVPQSNIEDILAYVTNQAPPRDMTKHPHGYQIFLQAYSKMGGDPGKIPNNNVKFFLKGNGFGTGALRWARLY